MSARDGTGAARSAFVDAARARSLSAPPARGAAERAEKAWHAAHPDGRAEVSADRQVLTLWNFGVGSAALAAGHEVALREFLGILADVPGLAPLTADTFVVSGSASPTGSAERNADLRARRAAAVQGWLIRADVPPEAVAEAPAAGEPGGTDAGQDAVVPDAGQADGEALARLRHAVVTRRRPPARPGVRLGGPGAAGPPDRFLPETPVEIAQATLKLAVSSPWIGPYPGPFATRMYFQLAGEFALQTDGPVTRSANAGKGIGDRAGAFTVEQEVRLRDALTAAWLDDVAVKFEAGISDGKLETESGVSLDLHEVLGPQAAIEVGVIADERGVGAYLEFKLPALVVQDTGELASLLSGVPTTYEGQLRVAFFATAATFARFARGTSATAAAGESAAAALTAGGIAAAAPTVLAVTSTAAVAIGGTVLAIRQASEQAERLVELIAYRDGFAWALCTRWAGRPEDVGERRGQYHDIAGSRPLTYFDGGAQAVERQLAAFGADERAAVLERLAARYGNGAVPDVAAAIFRALGGIDAQRRPAPTVGELL